MRLYGYYAVTFGRWITLRWIRVTTSSSEEINTTFPSSHVTIHHEVRAVVLLRYYDDGSLLLESSVFKAHSHRAIFFLIAYAFF